MALGAGWQGSTDLPILGEDVIQEPTPFNIDLEGLVEYFRIGFGNFEGIWQHILEEEDFNRIKALARVKEPDDFHLPIESWVRTVTGYSAAYQVTPRQRMKVLDTMTPHLRPGRFPHQRAERYNPEDERNHSRPVHAF